MIQQRKFCFGGRQGDRLVTSARWESENQSNGNISKYGEDASKHAP